MLVGFTLARSPLLLSLSMTSEARNRQTYLRASAAVIWDVDGTLVESTTLGFTATNEVLSTSGYRMVTEDEYKLGCRFTTPDRFNYHIERPAGSAEGGQLGDLFDKTYVRRVSRETAGLFDGLEKLLRSLTIAGHPMAVLSNACGEYVRAVLSANELDEKPGVRVPLFKEALGADEVAEAKPSGVGLLEICSRIEAVPEASVYVGDAPTDGKAARAAGMRSVGVAWGANPAAALEADFDVVVSDVPALIVALRTLLGDDEKS
ncbi:hypothetical protein EMIHUDRAFT_240976 [Emiliania huxleyi CCMP1516]|uniref:Phosphoglycolate phosphatase n=2 Tax=Emiliania huxleyi TaxID=2903 RepID=A0A0D3I3W3_EMIH1|nr:hypothetical protein EMIHUDRAFT_219663 [Emiliania huxleyi CCMP1516]XP_005774037.1 hypothetical protein EMIHUDRAFT_240976 [Emiliania huxleyi CCMP1516]EOD05948.1 hypothetical protein EMIHUDRAFT_219663 [Emiliania huxleyi CCMP1516]EOD21608.1 hypothetical protein EMIHUDRAFT_240976 [Emiliania huxleyi CCMP1516]|eukprot:XP_005758377.1 hypothetical protein EMIHUDRAFT_219663 [Emiliania huxleyi CCMP1516]